MSPHFTLRKDDDKFEFVWEHLKVALVSKSWLGTTGGVDKVNGIMSVMMQSVGSSMFS